MIIGNCDKCKKNSNQSLGYHQLFLDAKRLLSCFLSIMTELSHNSGFQSSFPFLILFFCLFAFALSSLD